MRYSKLFGKTEKENPSDSKIVSHQLLYRAGFIRESTAGRYFILPLGQKVQQNIIKVIKEEMDKVGAQEMVTPILHPLSLWEETNRTKTTGFELMKIKDRRDAEFALGGTAEEMFVDIVRKFQMSYKDLPCNLYQFSPKFRDELRARGGLLRVREFIMKDAYSFDRNEEEFKKVYAKMADVYSKIFDRLGLKTYMVESDNGYIGGDYCHEFIVESEIGDSTFLMTEDGSYAAHLDVAQFKKEDTKESYFSKEGKKLIEKKGIEVGNIFQLGYYYSSKMKDAVFIDQDGKEKPYYMGCYGIGIGRTMSAIVEVHHDEHGIIWPESVAPYQVYVINLIKNSSSQADAYYERLQKEDIDVLYDDREDVSAGEKFATADLIGIPIRLVISEKTGDKIELKERTKKDTELLSLDNLIDRISAEIRYQSV